jgi:hypothetical protein
MRSSSGPLCTKLRVATLADAVVVRAVTLRRGLSAGLDRARAHEAARVASQLAAAIVSCSRGGEILLDVDLEGHEFWIVAKGRAPGLEALQDYLSEGATSGVRLMPSPWVGHAFAAQPRECWSGAVKFELREEGGAHVSCVIPLVMDGAVEVSVNESEKSE